MSTSRYRRACHECQSRHLKCDIKKPCTPCTQAGRPCSESRRYQFRHEYNPTVSTDRKTSQSERFRSNQEWTKIPDTIVFTSDAKAVFSATDSGNSEIETPISNDDPQYSPDSSTFGHEELHIHNVPVPGPELVPDSSPQPLLVDRFEDAIQSSLDLIESSISESLPRLNGTYSPLEVESTLWPLSRKDEAILLQHFINEIALYFDFCNRERHFATIVVPAAATSPILHNALLAVSARHLSLTKNIEDQTPDKYQQECLRLLIPALAVENSFLDDKLFAATVLLRFFHEMTEPIDEPDLSAHVLNSHILMAARERVRVNCEATTAPSLRSATLNIELRQEIHIGFLTNRPPPASLVKYCNIDRGLDPASDGTWAWRAIAYAADVMAYCNGDDPKTTVVWRELWEYIDAFLRHLPPTFIPIFEEPVCPKEGRFLPSIWFATDCHAAAYQYMSIARILLLAHDPNVPPLGLARNLALESIDSQIKTEVLRICGIASSNRHFRPLLSCAGIAIAMCGDRFTNRSEQELLLELLGEMEITLTWPRLRAKNRLMGYWGWDTGLV